MPPRVPPRALSFLRVSAVLLPPPPLARRLADVLAPEPVQRVHAEPRQRRVIPRLGGRHGVGRAVHELERGERRDRALSGQRTRRAQLLQESGRQNPALVLLPQRARTRGLGLLRLQTRYTDISEQRDSVIRAVFTLGKLVHGQARGGFLHRII